MNRIVLSTLFWNLSSVSRFDVLAELPQPNSIGSNRSDYGFINKDVKDVKLSQISVL